MIAFIVFCALIVVICGVGLYVRRRDNEMDYPEAHGAGLSTQESSMGVLGANSAWSGAGNQL